MLVFRCKPGEEVILGDNQVMIKVLGADRRGVSIGFQAPNSMAINRAKVYEQKRNSGKSLLGQ